MPLNIFNPTPSISKRDLQRIPRVDIDSCPDRSPYLVIYFSDEIANPRERVLKTQPKGISMPFTNQTKTTRKENNYV